MKKLSLIILFIASLSFIIKAQGIQFENDNDLQTALAKAGKEGKLVFVDCYTDWCGPCKYLSSKIFPLKEVGEFYNEHFINLSINMEQKPKGVEVSKKYQIKAYPSLLFLDSKGELVHIGVGSGEANYILELGKSSLDDTKNLKALVAKLKKGNREAETISAYLRTYQEQFKKEDLLKDYFSTISNDEKYSQVSWELFKYYVNDCENEQFKFFISNRKTYEEKIGKTEVDQKMSGFFAQYLQQYKGNANKLKIIEDIDPELYKQTIILSEFSEAYGQFNQDNTDKNKWEILIQKAKQYFSAVESDADIQNTICWMIYENFKTFNDVEALKSAKLWSKKSVEMKPDVSYINDTYGHILFELGEIKEAIKYEEIAVEKGIAQGDSNVEWYKKEVELFKKSLN
jgi:thiol-disulfide isomerase/thioredoxin